MPDILSPKIQDNPEMSTVLRDRIILSVMVRIRVRIRVRILILILISSFSGTCSSGDRCKPWGLLLEQAGQI